MLSTELIIKLVNSYSKVTSKEQTSVKYNIRNLKSKNVGDSISNYYKHETGLETDSPRTLTYQLQRNLVQVRSDQVNYTELTLCDVNITST